jgi:hypothetical protein
MPDALRAVFDHAICLIVLAASAQDFPVAAAPVPLHPCLDYSPLFVSADGKVLQSRRKLHGWLPRPSACALFGAIARGRLTFGRSGSVHSLGEAGASAAGPRCAGTAGNVVDELSVGDVR